MTRYTNGKYQELFKDKERHALERAWKNRDFEISLFWKRASFFWVFITLSYAGYFYVHDSKIMDGYKIIACAVISSASIILAFIWFLAQLGSKKWQENWEAHIDMLETDIEGPIYKCVLDTGITFSVSKLSQIVTLLNFCFSVLLFVFAMIESNLSICQSCIWTLLLLMILVLIYFTARTNRKSKNNVFFLRESL